MSDREGARRRLAVLHDRIAERTATILEAQPSWPCRKGCDTCCHRLARPPELTHAEWAELWQGFLALEPETRRQVRARVTALAEDVARGARHFVCPLLARESGACLVYAHRPAACRMYGFYVSRGEGRYCDLIHDRVSRGDLDGVVWGNHDAVDLELAQAFGAPLSIVEWFERAPHDGSAGGDAGGDAGER
jgi:Fe-S-cluster containining protein